MSTPLKGLSISSKETTKQPRTANYKMFRFWRFHTDTNRAGPTRIQKYLSKRTPKFLRTSVPNPPPPYTISSQWKATKPEICQLSLHTLGELETFLHTNYKTKAGFQYKKGTLDIPRLSDSNTMILLLRNPESHICGCVISIVHEGLFGFTEYAQQPKPRIVQYLCIHPLLRGRGLAGWLLAWLDTFTHEAYGPCAHLGWWSAKSSYAWNPLPSIVQTTMYKMVLCPEPLRKYEEDTILQVNHAAAKRVLEELLTPNHVEDWIRQTYESFTGMYSIPSNQEVHWWKYTHDDLYGCSILVGLAPTQLEAPEGHIWQVVYCSYVRGRPGNPNDMFSPFWEESSTYKTIPKRAIELALNAQGVRVAIVSDIYSQYGGGSHPSNWTSHKEDQARWTRISQRSKLCIYNWMPSSFGFEDSIWIAPTL
jgi:hypothetical protein